MTDIRAIEDELKQLRGTVADLEARLALTERTPPATQDVVSRRHLLRAVGGAAVAGVGIALGSEILAPSPAAADQVFAFIGPGNTTAPAVVATNLAHGAGVASEIQNPDSGATGISSFTDGVGVAMDAAITNASSGNNAIQGKTNGTGAAVRGEITNTSNTIPATFGTTNGSGPGVQGRNTGTGRAVFAEINAAGNSAAALHASTNGTGPGVTATIGNANNNADALHATTNGNGNGAVGEIQKLTNAGSAVWGYTLGTGRGVHGDAQNAGTGVLGSSVTGIGVAASGGRAALLITPKSGSGAPLSGNHTAGEVVVDNAGDLFLCKIGTGTGVGSWLKVGYTPIDPVRVYDTRPGNAPVSNGDQPVGEGSEVIIEILSLPQIPDGASAVTLNVTVVSPTANGGFFSLYPANLSFGGPNPYPTFSNLNFDAGATVANLATVKVAPPSTTNAGKIKVFNAFGSSHVVLDVAGFYS